MCEDEHREREESVWSSMKSEASLQSAPNHVLPSDLCRMCLMEQLSASYYNREYDDSPGGVQKVWWLKLVLWIDRLGQSDGQRSKQVMSTVKADYG